MKFFAKLLTCILMLSFPAAAAYADGFASESDAVVFAQTPYDKKYVSIDWNTNGGSDTGVPVAYGEYLIVPDINKINKLSEKDGKTAASAELTEKVSRDCRGAVFGNILVQPTRTTLFAVDLDEMETVCSRKFGEIVTDVAAEDGRCFFGYKSDDKYVFCCADISNGFETVFEYETPFAPTSPAKLGGNVLFGAGSRLIVIAGDGAGGVFENEIGAEITHVYAGGYAVFMSCADGSLRKLRLDENGSAEDDAEVCDIGGELTAPAGLDNHIYIGSSEGFYIIDGLNMEIEKEFPELKNASAPVITVGSGVRAYTAAPHDDPSGERWYLYSILDTDESKTANELAKIIDYTNGRAAVSKSGRMFFRDARGQIWAISGSKPSVLMMVLKVVMFLAIVVIFILMLKAFVKKRQKNTPEI